jgi:hypothetical protein
MPPLEFDPHARDRMDERGVDEQDVELALKRQVRTRPGDPGSIWIDGYGKGGRIIPVCVLVANRDYIKTIGWPTQGRGSKR